MSTRNIVLQMNKKDEYRPYLKCRYFSIDSLPHKTFDDVKNLDILEIYGFH